MTVKVDGFSPVGGNHSSRADALGGVAEYAYKTNDPGAAIIAAGYFNELRDELNVGDVIHISASLSASVSVDPDAGMGHEFFIRYVLTSPKSPLSTNVTLNAKQIVALPWPNTLIPV